MTKIISVPAELERQGSDGMTVYKSLDVNSLQNSNLSSAIQAIVKQDYTSSLKYDEDKFPDITSVEQLQQILSELIIRFDTKPSNYTKKDYGILISVITGALNYLYSNTSNSDKLDELEELINQLFTLVQNVEGLTASLQQQISSLQQQFNTFASKTNTSISQLQSSVTNINTKFDNYYNKSEVDNLIEGIDFSDELSAKQDKLTSGSGISISNNEISAVVTEGFTTSVTVGGIQTGTKITNTVSIVDLLKQILTKIIDVVIVEPTVSISGSISAVEYGNKITNTVLSVSRTDGKFKSADPENYKMTDVNLGTAITSVTFKMKEGSNGYTSVQTGSSTSYSTGAVVLTAPVTYQAEVSLSASTNKAQTNQGTESQVKYNGGTKTTSAVSVTPYYYVFLGTLSEDKEINSTNIRTLSNAKIDYDISSKVLSGNYSFNSGNLVIACPSKYKLSEIKQVESGASYTSNFGEPKTVSIACGEKTCTYNVYVYNSLAPFNFNTITFKK